MRKTELLIPAGSLDVLKTAVIYGADAVAGVVNIRLRNRFEGAETTLRAGTA